jgi:hypothetical protein
VEAGAEINFVSKKSAVCRLFAFGFWWLVIGGRTLYDVIDWLPVVVAYHAAAVSL